MPYNTILIGASLSESHTCRKTSAVTVYIYIYIYIYIRTFRIILHACSNLLLAVQYLPMCSAYACMLCYAVFVLCSDTLSMTRIHSPQPNIN